MEEITITQKDSDGFDEIYAEWFVCPKCKNDIKAKAKFCSNCGIKLKWAKDACKRTYMGD